jgi:16S rRNA (adenine1518-N6/adenine1519-N6)-dimethyltransferase
VIVVRKRFGQHFLHDQSVLQRIVQAMAPQASDNIVEIGPGPGALTAALLQSTPSIDAVEIDRDLASALQLRWPNQLRLHVTDALRFDFAALAKIRGGALRIVGNLPYNISTPLLFHLLESRPVLQDLHVMLQKEVVDRICATPDSGNYGRLTVMLAPWLAAQKLFEVGPGAFKPPPRVWSAVVRLTVRTTPLFEVPPLYATVVAAAFSQRRKTLRNCLRMHLTPESWAATDINPQSRPETLWPAEFAALAALAVPAAL